MIENYRLAMKSVGIETTEDLIADGNLHRFHVAGDRSGTKNGWYILHGGEMPAGRFGSHKLGIDETWTIKDSEGFTKEEKALFVAKMKAAQQQRDAMLAKVQTECREWSQKTWISAKDTSDDHPYLRKKGIRSHGLKILGNSLLVPIRDSSGTIHGLQFISPDGQKKFKTGTWKHGNYYAIGRPRENTLLICEGVATGASLHESTGHAVAVAFDAGNLLPVAEILRKKFPDITLVLCADNDESGVGQEKAEAAAAVVGGVVAIPPDTGDDFNDLHQKHGAPAIEVIIGKTIKVFHVCGNNPTHPSFSSLSDSYNSSNPSSTFHPKNDFLIEEYRERKKLVPQSKAAEKISEMLHGRYAFSQEASTWYRYDANYWRMCNSSEVETEVTDLIYQGSGELGFNSNYPRGVMDLLRKCRTIALPSQDNRHIPFQNGLLEISTRNLVEIRPENAMTWILPCEYREDAQCQDFLKWLEVSVDSDKETIRLLRAWINAVLVGRPELQRFLHLIGPAGTGKSTFLRLIFQLVGKDNFTTTSLKQLETNRFEAANIYGKRLVSIEEADKYGGSVSILKSMTGQDPLRLERKNQQQEGSFIFDGQVLITSNERFATTDSSNGLERRRVTVDFRHWIQPEERAAWERRGGEERILWPEIPGIINWALQLSSDEVRASFQAMPDRIRKANLEAARINNSVLDWMLNNLIPEEASSIQVGDKREIRTAGEIHYQDEETRLYPNYLFWSLCNGRKPVSTRSFTDILLEQSRSYGVICRKVRKKDGTMIEGLRLRHDFEDSWLYRLEDSVKGEGSVKSKMHYKSFKMQEMKDMCALPNSPIRKTIVKVTV